MSKRQAVEMVLVTMLRKGHVLIEAVPGLWKTMLARVDGERAMLLRLQRQHPMKSLAQAAD